MNTAFKILLIFIPNLVFGQVDLTPPIDTALVFQPNLISTTHLEHSSPSINFANNLICWSMWEKPTPEQPLQVIMILELDTDTKATPISFSDQYSDGGPVWIDENRILFYSKRPTDSNKPNELINDLWISEKNEIAWDEPYCLEFSKFTQYAVSPSITKSGTIYYVGFADSTEHNMGIYYSKLGESGYEKPKLLPPEINSKYFDWTPFIAHDESYLIYSSNRPGSKDKFGDLFISFRNENDKWGEAINMGDKVNTDKQERFPSVSSDGRILFFTRATDDRFDDIYWIDSKIINDIRKK